MILQIIQVLLISLGFNHPSRYDPPRSLYPQQKYTTVQPMKFNISPIAVLVLFVVGVIVFTLVLLLFAPGTESGLFYNGLSGTI